jgi:uncharacterized membrane protein
MDKEKKFFQPKSNLDKFFEVSVLLKALDGMLEVIGGLLLLIIRPEHIVGWARDLTVSELKEDPHDFIANHIVHWANSYTKQVAIFAAVYLLLHGVIKVVLVFEVLRNHLWAYLALVIVTFVFVIYQVARIIEKPTLSFVLLTLFDVIVIGLTTREYRKQRQLREEG